MSLKLIAAALLTVFLPLGIHTVRKAYDIGDSPHAFAMLIFSGTMMILLGLTGLVGLLARKFDSREGIRTQDQGDDDPEADSGTGFGTDPETDFGADYWSDQIPDGQGDDYDGDNPDDGQDDGQA